MINKRDTNVFFVLKEKFSYPSTMEIMKNLRELDMQIGQEMDELEKLLGL